MSGKQEICGNFGMANSFVFSGNPTSKTFSWEYFPEQQDRLTEQWDSGDTVQGDARKQSTLTLHCTVLVMQYSVQCNAILQQFPAFC